MTILYIPRSRVKEARVENIIVPLPWGVMRDDAEAALSAATYPAIPAYDTGVAADFDCNTQTGTGTVTDAWWVELAIPSTYVAVRDMAVLIDGMYTLGGDAVAVAVTVDVEAFLYDSTNGDFSNTDACATTAQALATSYATETFTITGTTFSPGDRILIRFTSSIQITSAGAAGTGRNSFNNARLRVPART